MASTRQLRGGDYVLRVDGEELDILVQGLMKVREASPDFTAVPQEFKAGLEQAYRAWSRKLDGLDTKITSVSESEEEAPETVPAQREHVTL